MRRFKNCFFKTRIASILIAPLLLSSCMSDDPEMMMFEGVLGFSVMFMYLLPFIIIVWIIFNWDKVEDIIEGPIGKIIGVTIVIAIIWYFSK